MKRRSFFNAAVAVGTCVRLPQLAAAQSTGKEKRQDMQHEFSPGDKVPVTGVYDVIHDKVDGEYHALPHEITARAGTKFPPCRVCREQVRFRLHQAPKDVHAHHDFKP